MEWRAEVRWEGAGDGVRKERSGCPAAGRLVWVRFARGGGEDARHGGEGEREVGCWGEEGEERGIQSQKVRLGRR